MTKIYFGSGRSSQHGVAALEFALVATVFLMVLFGIASYGAAFVAQQSLARAAEDGARAMLQASLAPPVVSGATPLQTPEQFACAAAIRSAQWLSTYRERIADGPVLCTEPVRFTCNYNPAPARPLQCASVTLSYPGYRDFPLIPDLLPLGSWLAALAGSEDSWMPQDLSARATVQLGLLNP